MHVPRIVDVAPLGAVANEHAPRVDDHQRRPHERGQIGDRRVDVLMEAVSPPAEHAVPVFHRAGVLGEIVVLGNGDVDHLVGVDERRKNRPFVEHVALQAHGSKAMLLGQDDLGPHLVGRAPDARSLKAPVRVVARAVGDHDLLAPGLERELHDRADHVRVGVGGVDGHPVPTDVRLDDHDVAARNELAIAAHGSDGPAHELGRWPSGEANRRRALSVPSRRRTERCRCSSWACARLSQTRRSLAEGEEMSAPSVPRPARPSGCHAEYARHRPDPNERLSARRTLSIGRRRGRRDLLFIATHSTIA